MSNIQRVRRTIEEYLTEGTTVENVALAAAIGVTCGLFPIYGLTTVVTAFAGVVFRVNPVIVQVFNYLMYPIYFPCMFGFVLAGAYLSGRSIEDYNLNNLIVITQAGWEAIIQHLGISLLYAVLVWFVLCPIFVFILRIVMLNLFSRWKDKKSNHFTN